MWMDEAFDGLLKAAEKADQGKWEHGVDRVWTRSVPDADKLFGLDSADEICSAPRPAFAFTKGDANLHYIAKACPAQILRLRNAMQAEIDSLVTAYGGALDEIEKLKAEIQNQRNHIAFLEDQAGLSGSLG